MLENNASLLPILYQAVLLHVLPWNTSDCSASRTLCCHMPEANTNSFNTKYSLPLGSDHLISSLWKHKKMPNSCFFVPTYKAAAWELLHPKFWCFFQNTCKIKIWRKRIVIHLSTWVNPFTVWCGTSLWSEIKTLTILIIPKFHIFLNHKQEIPSGKVSSIIEPKAETLESHS